MNISKIRNVKTPERGTKQSAGIDFFVPNDFKQTIIEPHTSINIKSGIKVNIPKGFVLIAFNKSGVCLKKGLQIGACVIDEDYQGEIHLHLINTSKKDVLISPGDKIVQFILLPVNYCTINIVEENKLFNSKTKRGGGGFGSTGER